MKGTVTRSSTPASAARPPQAASRGCRGRSTLHHPKIVILELGGNDGLRALPIAQMRANLLRMVELAAAAGARGAAAGDAHAAQLWPGIHRAISLVLQRPGARQETAPGALPADDIALVAGSHASRWHSSQRNSGSRSCWTMSGHRCSRCCTISSPTLRAPASLLAISHSATPPWLEQVPQWCCDFE